MDFESTSNRGKPPYGGFSWPPRSLRSQLEPKKRARAKEATAPYIWHRRCSSWVNTPAVGPCPAFIRFSDLLGHYQLQPCRAKASRGHSSVGPSRRTSQASAVLAEMRNFTCTAKAGIASILYRHLHLSPSMPVQQQAGRFGATPRIIYRTAINFLLFRGGHLGI